MGGSILFTQSETFDPSLYGLTTGKFINYIIIGGGGAGGSIGTYRDFVGSNTYYASCAVLLNNGGANGGTSSIGTYVSALGGTTPCFASASNPTRYHPKFMHDVSGSARSYIYGGMGAGGWIPGKLFMSYQQGGAPTSESTSDLPDTWSEYYDGLQKIAVNSAGSAVTYLRSQSSSGGVNSAGRSNPYNLIQNAGIAHQGDDGIGYGAGGGGTPGMTGNLDGDPYNCATQGGGSGQFKQGSFKLESTNDIAITIGAGGTPHTSCNWNGTSITSATVVQPDNALYWSYGRIGTHGAVMLFWD